MVKPGAALSLQMHHHRAEHWIVVTGTAEVTNGDEVTLLSENQSTYIPLGQTHRLANPGKVPLEIIEVQSGSYLGEDDIVRFEDNYGRTPVSGSGNRPMILVTGGAGFIGANFVLDWLDADRRAGRQPRRAHLRRQPSRTWRRWTDDPRHVFVQRRHLRPRAGRRACSPSTGRARSSTSPPRATSTAASTGPAAFIQTNVDGTFTLLEAARALLVGARGDANAAFPLPPRLAPTRSTARSRPTSRPFTETTPYEPNSPYSASKAASDHLVRAWHHTYGLPVADDQLLATTTARTTSPRS